MPGRGQGSLKTHADLILYLHPALCWCSLCQFDWWNSSTLHHRPAAETCRQQDSLHHSIIKNMPARPSFNSLPKFFYCSDCCHSFQTGPRPHSSWICQSPTDTWKVGHYATTDTWSVGTMLQHLKCRALCYNTPEVYGTVLQQIPEV